LLLFFKKEVLASLFLRRARTAPDPEFRMYENFYGFSGSPFKLTPDVRFFYGSRTQTRALSHLNFGLSQGEGFIVITGEVGSGKTTLVERLWSQLDRDANTLVRISTTLLSGDDLLRLVASGFGVPVAGSDKAAMLLGLQEVLAAHQASGRRCLLAVDEAQNLPMAALEELRMLSNLTDGGRGSLQTLLLGQPQFRRMLASPDLDQLRQRVLASYHLPPMEADETRAYVEHRLSTVGWTGAPEIEPAAFQAVHRHSGGIPRRINRLCSRALLLAALDRAGCLTAEMVDSTAEELQADLEDGAPAPSPAPVGAMLVPMPEGQALSLYDKLIATQDELVERVETLELKVTQRERFLQRLKEAVAAHK